MNNANQQLQTIHSMMFAGQRNLRVERHSLWVWGMLIGSLALISTHILTPEQFSSEHQRAFAWLLLLASLISITGWLDWHLTRQVKQARDETWSFIHRQVFKVWVLLLLLGMLVTFAMFFYGGGYMLFAIWMVLIGLGLYIHGLFSEELLEWAGGVIMLIGVAMLASRISFVLTQWITASVTGVCLPLLAMLLDRGKHRANWQRLAQTFAWLVSVLVPPLLFYQYTAHQDLSNLPVTQAQQYQANMPGEQIVNLPAGSQIPIHIELDSNLFGPEQALILPLKLNHPVDVVVANGKLTGLWRIAGQNWHPARETRWIEIPMLQADFASTGTPQIRSKLRINVNQKEN